MATRSPLSPSSEPTLVPDSPLSQPADGALPSPSTISLSTVFQSSSADLILLSSDSVFFSVHSRTLRDASPVLAHLMDALAASNSYPPQLKPDPDVPTSPDNEARFFALPSPEPHPPTPRSPAKPAPQQRPPLILPLPEPAEVLNVILHLLYQMPCSHFYPTLPTLQAVLASLQSYQIPLPPSSFLSYTISSLLAAHAPLSPLYTYALAAHAQLEPLAVVVSRFCLSAPLSDVTPPLAELMGALYLRRLLFLHLGRAEALKRLLSPPPPMHPPTTAHEHPCDVEDQKKISRAWALATAYLAWGARADMGEGEMRNVLEPLGEKVECGRCRSGLEEHIQRLCDGWRGIKDTI